MKYNKIIIALSIAVCTLFSCTENWNDHYAEGSVGNGASLWENINANPELSNFAQVLQATGYADILASSQVFTVFAPTNDVFTEADRDSVIALYNEQKKVESKAKYNKAIKECLMNYISLYNYSVAGDTDSKITMLNGKNQTLTAAGFASCPFKSTNLRTANGVLYTIGGKAVFNPNVYEALEKDARFDSVYKYFHKYHIEEFIPERSIPGEIVDGRTQYLDSVTEVKNEIFFQVGSINDEDSTYWMIVPTNEVWKQRLEEYQDYYVYDKTVLDRDSFSFDFPRRNIFYGNVFSLSKNPEEHLMDSLVSTQSIDYRYRRAYYGSYNKNYYMYTKPYAPGGIMDGIAENVTECSNGLIYTADKWNFIDETRFLRHIDMEGETASSLDSIVWTTQKKNSAVVSYGTIESYNPYYNQVSNNAYMQISPASTVEPVVLFNVTNVLSNIPYDVYIVTVPDAAVDTTTTEVAPLPTPMDVTVYYNDLDGKQKYFQPHTGTTGPTPRLENDPTKLDTVYVDTYTFPTSSYGVSQPQVKLKLTCSAAPKEVRAGQATKTRSVRVDEILFIPRKDKKNN